MEGLDLSRPVIQMPSPSLFSHRIYVESIHENYRLFSHTDWSPTSNKKIINISRFDSLHRIINHRLDRWCLLGLIHLNIGQELQNLLLFLLHKNKSRKELVQNFILMARLCTRHGFIRLEASASLPTRPLLSFV